MKKDFLNKQTDVAEEIIGEIFSEYLNDVEGKTSEVEIPGVEDTAEKVVEKTPYVEDASPKVEDAALDAIIPSFDKEKEKALEKELRNMELREADELERFFSGVDLPNEPVDVVPGYCIVEPAKYIKAALRAIRDGRYNTDEFLDRLRQLRNFINANPNKEVSTRWKKEDWSERIASVEERLSDCKLSAPIKLDGNTEIADIDKFIASHLAVIKSHNGNKLFEPYLQRLEKLAGLL